jgi:hypothetical protein
MATQKGKRPNAHNHGVFSETAILSGEDEREFEKLRAALIEEWRPVGAIEEDAVLSIAKAVWRTVPGKGEPSGQTPMPAFFRVATTEASDRRRFPAPFRLTGLSDWIRLA